MTTRKKSEAVEGTTPLSPLADVRLQDSREPGLARLPVAALRLDAEARPRSARDEPNHGDFRHVYALYFQRVAHWVRAFGGLDADVDDLTQEVFLVVQRKLSTFQGASLAAWLYGIARKTVSDHRRRAWFRRWLRGADDVDDMHAPPAHGDPSASFERKEARRVVSTILNQMSAVRRSTFVLFEIEGYSGEEIAELERVPVNTVYTRLHHARKDFFKLMAEHQAAQAGGQP